jgi:predicted aspartyl protease
MPRRVVPAICLSVLLVLGALPALAVSKGDALDRMVKQLRYEDLEAKLPSIPATLEYDYFAGILANREGRAAESIRLLEGWVAKLKAENPLRAAQALETLSDDYIKVFRYNDAADTCNDLLEHFPKQLSNAERSSEKDDCATFNLLRNVPAQTMAMNGPMTIPTQTSPIGSIDAQLTVNGVTVPWLLDTGANFSVVSMSFAQRLGLTLSAKEAHVKGGVNGFSSPLRTASLPELNLGSARVFNVVLLVMEDKDLTLPTAKGKKYVINAIVGFPVLHALGSITFAKGGEFSAITGRPEPTSGARLFMNKLTPLLEATINNKRFLFSFDTGANGTQLSERYFEKFSAEVAAGRKAAQVTAGAGGSRRVEVYILPEVKLAIGQQPVWLKNVSVFPFGVGTNFDEGFGNLGRDVVADFASFTLDFRQMRFFLGAREH